MSSSISDMKRAFYLGMLGLANTDTHDLNYLEQQFFSQYPNGIKSVFSQAPVSTKIKILVVGSSNAAGFSASTPANSWVGRLTTALAATHTIINVAVSGVPLTYWITPDSTGRSPLEQAIIANSPHIVIGSFTTQNDGGPSASHILNVETARFICNIRGIRFIGVTPYGSSSYTSAQWDASACIGNSLKRRGIPLFNFGQIWGTGTTPPAIIDSGDGLHLNDAGHLEQFSQIPLDYLKLTSNFTPLFMPTTSTGVTIPSGLSNGNIMTTNGYPTSSWTLAFRVKLASGTSVALATGTLAGAPGVTRIRVPNTGQLDVAGGIVHSVQTVSAGTEYHVALTLNGITKQSVLYINGVAVSTTTATDTTFGNLSLGGNYTAADGVNNAVGYQYRNLTIHSTVLNSIDIQHLSNGDVPLVNLFMAAPLDDGINRPVGAYFASAFGTTLLTTAVAIA